MTVLPRAFYEQEVIFAARSLLGKRLVRHWQGLLLSGIIVETEAYRGEEDLACHARSGRTQRTAVMYGPAGHAYVYFTYGMHWCLNAVCGAEGTPAAVLLRAVWPLTGLEEMAKRRGRFPVEQWCNGPAKLCQAFVVNGDLNGTDLCLQSNQLWIEDGPEIPDVQVTTGPRVGIQSVPEPWRSQPWRYLADLTEAEKHD
jgi:DNA-3-methyladenine glycosylase